MEPIRKPADAEINHFEEQLVEAEDKLFARIKVIRTLCDRLEKVVGTDEIPRRK